MIKILNNDKFRKVYEYDHEMGCLGIFYSVDLGEHFGKSH